MNLLSRQCLLYLAAWLLVSRVAGCKTAYAVIRNKQQEALGKTEDFSIERPSSIFRRRLLEAQGLPYASEASLGTDRLQPIDHWPEDAYPHRNEQGPQLDIPAAQHVHRNPLRNLPGHACGQGRSDYCPPT